MAYTKKIKTSQVSRPEDQARSSGQSVSRTLNIILSLLSEPRIYHLDQLQKGNTSTSAKKDALPVTLNCIK